MDLDVLACGQVVLARAVLVAHIEDGAKLAKRQEAHGDLDADHLDPGLSLAIHPSSETQAAEPLFVDGAFFETKDASIQIQDVLLDNGVVNLVDEAEHDGCVKWVKKKPPSWEALVNKLSNARA